MEENKKMKITKNIVTLCIGASIIIVALIAFLISYWDSINNGIKVGIILIFEVLFIIAGKLFTNKYQLKDVGKTFHYIALIYLPFSFFLIFVLELLGSYFTIYGQGKYIYLSISSVITTLFYLYYYIKDNDREVKYLSIIFGLISTIFVPLIFKENISLVIDFVLIYTLLLKIFTKDELIKKYMIYFLGLVFLAMLSQINDVSFYFIFSWVLLAINIINLERLNSNIFYSLTSNACLYTFAYMLVFKKIGLVFELSVCQIAMIIFILILYLVTHILIYALNGNKNLLTSARIIPLSASLLLYLISISQGALPLYIIALLIEFILIFNYVLTKNGIYKYAIFIFSNVLLINIFSYYFEGLEFLKFIPLVTTSFVLMYNLTNKRELNEILIAVLAVMEFASLILLIIEPTLIGLIVSFIFTCLILCHNKYKHIKSYYDIIPLFVLIAYASKNMIDNSFISIIYALLVIVLIVASYLNNKDIIYPIFSGLYLVFINTLSINNNYFITTLVCAWSLIHLYIYNNSKYKFLFNYILIISTTILSYLIFYDTKLLDYTIIKMLGVSIGGILIINDLIKKTNSYYEYDLNIIKYIFWSLIYLYAISSYISGIDGLMFSIYIVFVLCYSYYKKVKETFAVSIVFILINSIYLTKEFWLSLPWWIYLFILGGGLIIFAIVNERNKNNKNDDNIIDILKERFKNDDQK